MSSISGTGNKSEVADQYATQQAEKEKLRTEHEAEIERLKKSYSTEKQDLQDRFESTYQSEKQLTYDNLRNAKKQFTSAEKNLKSMGDEHLEQKKNEYHQEESRITKEGTQRVDEALRKQSAIEEYQRNQATAAESIARHNNSHNAQLIIQDSDQKIENLRQNKMDVLEKRKAEHGIAVEQIKEHYNQRQNNLLAQHEKETQHIKDGVDGQINKTVVENAKRLEVNAHKQEDPFYRMSHIDSDFSDLGEVYQLKVRLPEYERKGFRVQISGQELQFSGMRSSNQKAEIFPGHEATTDSYQSFSERYKFDTPVDANAMHVSQEGDWMLYTIPKYGANHRMREQNIQAKMNKQDLEMSRDMDFKDTLPLPKMLKDQGSGTLV